MGVTQNNFKKKHTNKKGGWRRHSDIRRHAARPPGTASRSRLARSVSLIVLLHAHRTAQNLGGGRRRHSRAGGRAALKKGIFVIIVLPHRSTGGTQSALKKGIFIVIVFSPFFLMYITLYRY